MKRSSGAILAAIGISFAVFRCTMSTAGIETTNGATIVAAATGISGTAPAHARVSLFDTAYVPVVDNAVALITAADDSGSFDIDGLMPGAYTVIIESPDDMTALLFKDVVVGRAAEDIRQGTLAMTGTLVGEVSGAVDDGSVLLVYLAGTGYYCVLSEPGPFSFESVPQCVYDLVAVSLVPGGNVITPRIVSDSNRRSVEVFSGRETTVEAFPVWK